MVTFQPYDHLGFEVKGFGENFLLSLGYDVLCFKTIVNDWYQNISLQEMKNKVSQFTKHYSSRVGYGSSMGAYAILYFSETLDLQRIIAISPQFSIDRNIVPFELRWGETTSISFSHAQMSGCGVEVTLIYDPFDKLDKRHVSLIRQCFLKGQDIALPFTGHPSVSALSECNLLRYTIESLLCERDVDFRKIQKP